MPNTSVAGIHESAKAVVGRFCQLFNDACKLIVPAADVRMQGVSLQCGEAARVTEQLPDRDCASAEKLLEIEPVRKAVSGVTFLSSPILTTPRAPTDVISPSTRRRRPSRARRKQASRYGGNLLSILQGALAVTAALRTSAGIGSNRRVINFFSLGCAQNIKFSRLGPLSKKINFGLRVSTQPTPARQRWPVPGRVCVP